MDSAHSCALLQQLLREKNISPKGVYHNKDVAEIFGVSTRTVQTWVHDGKLQARNLPGCSRFLSQDLELFLEQSLKSPAGGGR